MDKNQAWQDYLERPLEKLRALASKRLRQRVARACGGGQIRHLLLHAPVASKGDSLTHVRVQIVRHSPPKGKRITPQTPYRVTSCDEAGEILTLIFFRGVAPYIENQLPVGAWRFVKGRLAQFGRTMSMAHPEISVRDTPKNELSYDGLKNVTSHHYAVQEALRDLPPCDDWLEHQSLSCRDALTDIHQADIVTNKKEMTHRLARLAYDELLARHLTFALNERAFKKEGRAFPSTPLPQDIFARLEFTLTSSQQDALKAIIDDMNKAQRMLRLLQGDVGSGKTIVALLAMMKACLAGSQAALMAPTALLATQTARIAAKMASPYNIATILIHGGHSPKERQEKQWQLLANKNCLVIGTHALFQEKTKFSNLGLIVIDEQQRFGVAQRLALYQKTKGADVLAMSATPIPRSLWLAQEGTLDVCVLREKPQGRQKIKTVVAPAKRMEDVRKAIKTHLDKKRCIYWVCPFIEDEEFAVKKRSEELSEHFPNQITYLYGSMKAADKERILRQFKQRQTPLLVSTTVIEVGIDVPEASLMIIERAEHFGLAQLHQLRGRIGRGKYEGICILLYEPPLSDASRARLDVLRKHEDGFVIAEEDLRLRGAGDPIGIRQSGMVGWRFFNPLLHQDMMARLASDVSRLLNDKNAPYRPLLALFNDKSDETLIEAG